MKLLVLMTLALFSIVSHAQLSNESELGIAAANGNTKTQTVAAKQLNDYKWAMNVLSLRARLLNSEANGVETARYLMGGLRYEKQISNHFGLFAGQAFEKDKFAGIEIRYMSDVGGKYRFIESDITKLFSELGYRYMHEERTDGTFAFSSYIRFYSEWENKWNNNFSTRYWAEMLPNLSENNDWQFNTEFSLSAILNSTFSLKSGILLRYDHLPAPGVIYKTDTLFTTALVAKF
ncbi:MAG TPA: DUF481 domain-containing protein [Bacteriovoracaceae bacterium]|nr:DUF481 domain-containing protein [Bacteriovoracaceae bacterium]